MIGGHTLPSYHRALVNSQSQYHPAARGIKPAHHCQRDITDLDPGIERRAGIRPIQIDQHENEMAVAPLSSRATATICGKYEIKRSTLNTPNDSAT